MKTKTFLLLFLILLTLAAGYLIRNFTGIGPIPVRSSFAGRLPSIADRTFRFFYATNRLETEDRGNILSDTISTGTFDVHISPYLTIRPFEWFDTDSMRWIGKEEVPKDTFYTEIAKAVQASPHKSLLVVVWGYRDWFHSAALKTAYTAYALDINTPVLLFDWPGNQGDGFRGYLAAQEVATKSAPDLGHVLNQIKAENIWLMGSSLGCQTISDALVWMADQPEHSTLNHVILSAPDVSADAFSNKFKESMQKVSKHLTAFVSSNDRALLMSHWINRGRRLGRKAQVMTPPENRTVEYEFEEALELLDMQVEDVSVVDATPINGTRNLHHFFTDSPAFFDDLYQRLLQPDDIVNRRLHLVRTPREGVNYWILWND